jgi:serine/threonine protein kinase
MRILSSTVPVSLVPSDVRDLSSGSYRCFTRASHPLLEGREGRTVVEAAVVGETRRMWRFDEGEEIAPGRFAVSLLGGGRGHEAYLAWDDQLFSLVVAKILRPHLVDDEAARRQLAAEADAYAALHHPVLPRSFGAVLDGGRPHLVLEFLDGPRLSTLVRKQGLLAVEQTLPLAVQLASALHYMSRCGWVHLDVKPKNVVMGAPPRLIDLSIARTRVAALRTAGPIGTDAYMAPEQCGVPGSGAIGTEADIWGLGVTVYEAITGRLPFPAAREDGPPNERFPQLVHEPTPFSHDVPPVLADPILSCLRKRPEDRPTAEELAAALQPLVAGLPKPSLVPRIRPRVRRRSPR